MPAAHVAHPGTRRLCRHLLGPDGPGEAHVRLLTGHRLDYDLCCTACDEALQAGRPAELIEACEGCVDDAGEDWCHADWRGKPGIDERPEPLDTSISETPLPAGLGGVSGLAPVTDGSQAVWLVLAADGWIGRLDAGSGRWEPLARTAVPAEPARGTWRTPTRRLHASPGGEFAAVFDASTGDETLAFAGPRGALFADDRRLYAAAPGQLEVWDPFTGERTGVVPGFTPTHFHPGAAELAAVEGATLRRWSTSHPGPGKTEPR